MSGNLGTFSECEHPVRAPEGTRGADFDPGGRHDALGAEISGGENHDGVCHGHSGHCCSSEVKNEESHI